MRTLNFSLGPTAIAEANTQQAFVDILDNSVIKPLAIFKASEYDLVWAGISVLIIGRSDRKRKMRQEVALGKISRIPPRGMPIMQRTVSRSSKRHTSRNITLSNMLPLLVASWQRSQNITNNRFPGPRNDLSEPEPPEAEGVANVAHGLQKLLLN
jgi:hypothetical protein